MESQPVVIPIWQARIFYELLSRDREDGRARPPCEQGEAGGPPGLRLRNADGKFAGKLVRTREHMTKSEL